MAAVEIHLLGIDAELFIFVAFTFHRPHTKVLCLPTKGLGVPRVFPRLRMVSSNVQLGCASMLLGSPIVRRSRLLMLRRGPHMILRGLVRSGHHVLPWLFQWKQV